MWTDDEDGDVIRLEALPAGDGDCLWMEWISQGNVHRILIDGGRGKTAALRLNQLPADDRHLDLVVCTHYDADHIEGLLRLFSDPPLGFSVGDVWFNGHRHIRQVIEGPQQASRFERLLDRSRVPWNVAFGNAAVVVPDEGPLPVIRLPGMTLTLVAPTWEGLARLDAIWPEVLAEEQSPLQASPRLGVDSDAHVPLAELAERPYEPDSSVPNASSISFIAQDDEGSRILFTADATAEALLSGLRRLEQDKRVGIDLCKVPHHGSGHNVNAELVDALDCRHWLFSTNGARHGHPDRRAVARIVKGAKDPVLWFNYRSVTTEEYADGEAAVRQGFRAFHPVTGQGMTMVVFAGGVEPSD